MLWLAALDWWVHRLGAGVVLLGARGFGSVRSRGSPLCWVWSSWWSRSSSSWSCSGCAWWWSAWSEAASAGKALRRAVADVVVGLWRRCFGRGLRRRGGRASGLGHGSGVCLLQPVRRDPAGRVGMAASGLSGWVVPVSGLTGAWRLGRELRCTGHWGCLGVVIVLECVPAGHSPSGGCGVSTCGFSLLSGAWWSRSSRSGCVLLVGMWGYQLVGSCVSPARCFH